ncbi:MAG: SEL1-like repeat protein [Alphaproteobacteria bacterium]
MVQGLRRAALVVALVALTGVARADYAAGWIALERGDPQAALAAWRADAEAGDLDLQFNIGALYESGALGRPDYGKAATWYRRAAERHLGAAAVRLARLAALGFVEDDDSQAAVDMVRQAAERGSAEAMVALGAAHEAGRGVPKDEARAVALYRRAAELGHQRGAYGLARAYAHGMGVARDLAEAERWYRRAAEAGVPEAQNNLGYLYEHGQGVAPDPARALEWYRRAARSGLTIAQVNLGMLYEAGTGVARDDGEAVRWFRLAARQGDGAGQLRLALHYANGLGVERDATFAYAWFDMAARAAERAVAAHAVHARALLAARLTPEELALAVARAGDLWLAFRGRRVRSGVAPVPTEALGFNELFVQRGLALLGYYGGTVDGIAGSGTARAVRAFQGDAGLAVDGAIGETLLAALRRAVAAREAAWDRSRSPI